MSDNTARNPLSDDCYDRSGFLSLPYFKFYQGTPRRNITPITTRLTNIPVSAPVWEEDMACTDHDDHVPAQ
eukprot:gene16498-703_t